MSVEIMGVRPHAVVSGHDDRRGNAEAMGYREMDELEKEKALESRAFL